MKYCEDFVSGVAEAVTGENGWAVGIGQKKSPVAKGPGLNKYGSYLLSRIVVQYHRP